MKSLYRKFVVGALLLGSAGVLAQATSRGTLASNPATRSLFDAAAKQTEMTLVPLVLRRVDTTGAAQQRLEVELDLLIVGRWLANTTVTDDDLKSTVFLRMAHVQAATDALREHFKTNAPAPFNKAQANASRQLHQLTYDLPATIDATRMDEVCRSVGACVLDIATGEVTNPSQVPLMRPATLPPPRDEIGPAPVRVRTNTVDRSDPARLIPQLAVSQPLRQQLLTTFGMVRQPAENGLSDQDAMQLRQVLNEAIDIAAGLSGNAGVSAEDRTQLEQQLTESLALYGDRRLRDLAKSRINAMSRYRQVLGSITRLNLSEANYKLLAPAFEYAQKTPAESKLVLGSLERFVQFCTAFDKTPTTLTYSANPALARSLQRPYDDSRKSFDSSRAAFLEAVENLGGGAMGGTTSADLNSRLDEMRLSLDVIDSLGQMPQTMDTFSAYKPKPIGGLEKRISKEAATAASPGKGPLRLDAANVLKDLIRVADTARDLEKLTLEGPRLAVYRAYTSKTPEDLTAKWRGNVTDIASQAAAGMPLDQDRIERNERLSPLVASLGRVVDMEAQLQQSGKLQRWADWGIDAKATEQVITPYRSAAAAAFTGFLGDNSDAMRSWVNVQRDRRHQISFVLRSIGGAAELPELPSPLHLAAAKLMTPMNTPKYALQRYFSLASTVLGQVDVDAASADSIRKEIDRRMQQQ